jgi:hypothetical protein
LSDEFPADVAQYVRERVDSVAQLEVLLRLREDPQQAWTAEDVSQELKLTRENAHEQLQLLVAQGVARVETGHSDQFLYAPRDPALREVLDRLAAAYEQRRVTVITLIYSKPVDKVRTFADAFRLRKES